MRQLTRAVTGTQLRGFTPGQALERNLNEVRQVPISISTALTNWISVATLITNVPQGCGERNNSMCLRDETTTFQVCRYLTSRLSFCSASDQKKNFFGPCALCKGQTVQVRARLSIHTIRGFLVVLPPPLSLRATPRQNCISANIAQSQSNGLV